MNDNSMNWPSVRAGIGGPSLQLRMAIPRCATWMELSARCECGSQQFPMWKSRVKRVMLVSSRRSWHSSPLIPWIIQGLAIILGPEACRSQTHQSEAQNGGIMSYPRSSTRNVISSHLSSLSNRREPKCRKIVVHSLFGSPSR